MYLRKRMKVKQQSDRRNIFLRYLGEVAKAVGEINDTDEKKLYDQLVEVARRRTADADVKLDKHGRPAGEEELELGENVLIVDPAEQEQELLAMVGGGSGEEEMEEEA
jgi:DNA topoisomerase-6 subunit B